MVFDRFKHLQLACSFWSLGLRECPVREVDSIHISIFIYLFQLKGFILCLKRRCSDPRFLLLKFHISRSKRLHKLIIIGRLREPYFSPDIVLECNSSKCVHCPFQARTKKKVIVKEGLSAIKIVNKSPSLRHL